MSLLTVYYLAYVMLSNTTFTSKQPYPTARPSLIVPIHSKDSDFFNPFTAQYSKHSFCPNYRPPEYTISLSSRGSSMLTKIGIVLAITSKTKKDQFGHKYNITKHNMVTLMPTFKSLLPSFCRTASYGYDYHFFFGYDIDDAYFTRQDFRNMFANTMLRIITLYCPSGSAFTLHFVQCTHTRHVSWAQNDAGNRTLNTTCRSLHL
jgi:hypothetical protein